VTDGPGMPLPGLLARVNARIRELAGSQLGGGGPEEEWGFRCECGEMACREFVPLSLAEYEAHRDADRPILSPEHRAPPAALVRRSSLELRADATALQAQARHQRDRASRNREIALQAAATKLDLVCGKCGYGVIAPRPPGMCPICHASDWQPRAPKPES
jgi:rubrerythrin